MPSMKLKAKSLRGVVYDVECSGDTSVESLKEMVQEQSSIPKDMQRLVHDNRVLYSGSVSDAGIKDGDTIVVMTRRRPPAEPQPDTTPAPSSQDILNATAKAGGGGGGGGDTTSTQHASSSASAAADDEPIDGNELRAQLQDMFGRILGFTVPSQQNPAAGGGGGGGGGPPAPPQAAPVVDPPALQQLTDFGFPEARARKALLLNRMNPQLAMEWLLEHSDDPDADMPLSAEQLSQVLNTEANFVVDHAAAQSLTEMGFSLDDVHAALRATNNDQEAACAWLLGDREAPEEADMGIDENSPIVHAILTNPIVQAGISNPRVLQAFRMMLEDPQSTTQFIGDPEIGPVLMQVHQILNGNGQNRSPP